MAESPRETLDRFSSFPFKAALILSASYIVVFETLDFMPLLPQPWSGLNWVRNMLFGMFFPLTWPFVWAAFEIGFLLFGAIALFKRRIRRASSFACACLIVPLVVFALPRLTIFSPYYWYVLLNQVKLERAGKVHSQTGDPVPVVLETRDVSFGLVSNPATFISIVYDEIDGLRDSPEPARRLSAVEGREAFFEGAFLTVRPLFGHFYVVTATY
jgi:hypothetical protein